MKTRVVGISLIILMACMAFQSCATVGTFESVYTGFKQDLNLEDSQSYVVLPGDTLSALTISFYGEENGYYFPMIMGASSDVVTHPDKIAPGMVLTIPSFPKNIEDPVYAKKVKGWFYKVADIYRSEDNAFVADEIVKVADKL